ncbi:phosphotransferase [Actinoplanes sp. NEAU-A12]|uniref:Phosphotransferase n=1 Tax=Actinoplanes sandaracinus TaxID=3045177 RepID=A0ABT6WCR3_9ACTN|nr:phosphotransferase [Actinoplanes sandaracinus]MDI6097500.1 phosphotransferase [Actinoplanes sandaracinus]
MFDDLDPVASGRDADVFAIDDRRVLRRYRDGGEVANETAIMDHVAQFGFPVPAVYEAYGANIMMERLHGPTMLEACAAGDLAFVQAGVELADLHRRLHAIPPLAGKAADDRILHLDLHPQNIMVTARGPVVIDWRNAAEGPADLDIAMSAMILAQVAVDDVHPLADSVATLLTAFLNATDGDPLSALTQAAVARRDDPNITAAEVALIDAAVQLITVLRHPSG